MSHRMPPERIALLQQNPNPVMIYRDGRIIWANEAAERVLVDPIGSEVLSHVVVDDRERIAARMHKIAAGQVDSPARLTIQTTQGPRIIESAATLIELPDGPAIQTTWRDLTDLERMRTWLESVADSTSDLIAIASLSGEIHYMNEALLSFRGERDRSGLPDGRILIDHLAPGQEHLVEEAATALRTGGRWRGELELTRNGAPVAISVVLQRHEIAGSGFFSAIGRDVTAERDLRRELERAIRERDTFAARVAHEIRNPLTGIVGTASLLADADGLDREQRELVDLIATGASDVQRVVEDLAAFSSHGSEVQVSAVTVDLHRQIEQVVVPIAESSGKHFRVQASGSATADPNRIRQIVRNLVINAVRYGGDRISVEAGSDDAHAFIAVIDDGDGVSDDAAGWIFDEYRSAHDPTLSLGMGLGLAVARQLAKQMGGDLEYRRVGGETIFILTLPPSSA